MSVGAVYSMLPQMPQGDVRSCPRRQDYLLDQLLMGRDCAIARAVAQGNVEEGAPILKALAHDLDRLQVGLGCDCSSVSPAR